MLAKTKKFYLFANLALIFFGLFIALAGAEIFFRWQHYTTHKKLAQKYSDRELCHRYAEDRDLVYAYVAHRCGHNAQGYPDDEHTLAKPENTYRILIIGDSIARGHGIGVPNSFGKQLERKSKVALGKKAPHVEVILLAVSGYSTSQELIMLKNEAKQYSPDLLLWSYVLNDPAHPVYHNANGEIGVYFNQPRSYVVELFARWWFSRKEAEKVKICDNEYHRFLHCAYWEQVEKNIIEIANYVNNEGIRSIFMIHPVFEENSDFEHYTLAPLHQKLNQTATQAGLQVIDFLDAYKPYRADDLRTQGLGWFDPWHPNRKGHRVMADALFALLQGDILVAYQKL